jgi:hypothetical protein
MGHRSHRNEWRVRAVRARGASLKATEQPIDTSTAAGKCFLDMLGVVALGERSESSRVPAGPPLQNSPLQPRFFEAII